MVEAFTLGYLQNMQILFVAIIIFAIIFAILKKIQLFGDNDRVNGVIALVSAIIVSLTGVITYTITYAINYAVVVLFFVFLVLLMLMFMGVKMSDLEGVMTGKFGKWFAVLFVLIFGIILLKGLSAVNNLFDTNNPQDDPYLVNTEFNTGTDDVFGEQAGDGFFDWISQFVDPDMFWALAFLGVLLIFVFVLGRGS